MGIEYYLVNEEEQTVFDLGKGPYSFAFNKLSIGFDKNIHDEEVEFFCFEDAKLLLNLIETEVNEGTYGDLFEDKEYCNWLCEGILKFSKKNMIYIMPDNGDYFILNNWFYKKNIPDKFDSKFDYKQVGSRYLND